jgi:hypothetical protein
MLDKECREGKQAARKKLRNWKKEKETDARRTEDEGYKDGRRGVEIHK